MKRTLKSAKSRMGCQRCKTRRVKCDEAKPACKQCTAASVACPGYATQLRWSSKHEVFPKHSKTSSIAQQSPSSTDSGFEHTPYETPAGQLEDNEMIDMSASPGRNPGLDHGLLGFFDDIFDLSPSYVQDISWSMQPTGMFDDWNPVGSLPGFDIESDSVRSHELRKDIQQTNDNMATTDGGTHHACLDTPISNPPTTRPRMPAPAKQSTSTSLLGTFYRLSTPTQVPSFSENDLVSYFQSEVCPLLSVFDSDVNPFQTIVAELGTSSRTVNLAMQSMAIGHLANHYPYMAPVGLSKRWQAWRSLQQDLAAYRRDRLSLEKILISILLLGSTSVWHPGPSQGPQYLLIARNIMQKHLQDRNGAHTTSLLHEDFFQNCLIYWEQTMSFVDPTVTMPSFPGFGAPALRKPTSSIPVHPHPWTGVSPEVHFATAEIGRILRRRQRFRNSHPSLESEARWAESLEEYLYSLEFPAIDNISNFGDSNTSKSDLVRIAEAYRFFGLIELYALYPELLSQRLRTSTPFEALGVTRHPTIDDDQPGDHSCWLTHIALHVIEIIKAIPISSGASRNQIAILVAVSSHLRLVDGDHGSDSDQILSARYFVESSLLNMARKYAQRPAAQAIDVVKEVWARLDSASPGEHWMAVAHEKRWLSFLG